MVLGCLTNTINSKRIRNPPYKGDKKTIEYKALDPIWHLRNRKTSVAF